MSIFNFKRRADEPYELGELIGEGISSTYHKLKGKKKLGVKIYNYYTSSQKVIENFNNELKLGNFLRKKGITVPRYVGIVNIFDSILNEYKIGLVIEIKNNSILVKVTEFNLESQIGPDFKPSDLTIVCKEKNSIIGEKTLEIKLKSEIKESICNVLNEMIRNLSIPKEELIKKIKCVDFQGLYSIDEKIFYLIDFQQWKNFL